MKQHEKEFLAWLTGFWEGEGSFSIVGDDCRFQVGQSGLRGKKIILEIKDFFDKLDIYSYLGKTVSNCHTVRVGNIKDVNKIFKLILPYIRFRKEEVEDKLSLIKNRKSTKRWSMPEKIYLTRNYNLISKDKIAVSLDRSLAAIWKKANELKLTRRRHWTKEEIEILNSHISLSMKQIGEKLNRSYGAVKAKRYKLRLF